MGRFRVVKSFLFLILFLPMVVNGAECTTYTDIGSSSYKSDILYASDVEWVSCKDTFNPLSNTTRREAIAMAVLAGGHTPPPSSAQCFDDIVDETWSRDYICFAKAEGIIADNPSFRPGDEVSFEEASKMMLRSMTSDDYGNSIDFQNYLDKMALYGFNDNGSATVNRDYFINMLVTINTPKIQSMTLSSSNLKIGDSLNIVANLDRSVPSRFSVNLVYKENAITKTINMSCSGLRCTASISVNDIGDNQSIISIVNNYLGDNITTNYKSDKYNVVASTPTDPVVPIDPTPVDPIDPTPTDPVIPVDPTPPTPVPTISISSVEASPSSVNIGESIIYIANLSESITSGYSAYLKFTDTTVSDELMTCNANRCDVSRVMNGVGIDRPFRINLKKDGAIVSFKDGIYSVVTPDIPMIREVKVNPTTALEGESFNFSATLTSELLANQSVKYQLEADAEDVYLAVTDVPCVALECKVDRVITKARYNRKVRFGVFEGDKLISTGWKYGRYDVDANPALNDAPQHIVSYPNAKGSTIIPLGQNFKFYTEWSDTEGDYVVAVTVRYRKVGTTSWNSEVVLDHYRDLTFTNNKIDLKIDEVGMYEFEVKASDKVDLDAPIIHPATWVNVGSFEVKKIVKPMLIVQDNQVDINSGEDASFELQVIDSNDDIDKILVYWYAGDKYPETFRNLHSGDIINPSNKIWTMRTVTAIAYDLAGNKSVPVEILINPAQHNQHLFFNSPTIAQNPLEITVGDPVGLATGAEKFTLSFLKQKGLHNLSFDLSYNSLLFTQKSFGQGGWSSNDGFTARIQEKIDGNLIVYWNDKNYNIFKVSEDNSSVFKTTNRLFLDDTLTKNSDKSYTLVRQNRLTYYFDKYGILESIENYKKQKLGFIFDENSSLNRVTDVASGLFIEYYYKEGKVTKVSDTIGREVLFTYSDDNSSHLIQITAPKDIVYNFEYNEVGQITQATYGDGTVIFKNSYLTNGLASTQDDGLSTNKVSTYAFDHNSSEGKILTRYGDRNSQTTYYEFNATNYNLLSIINILGHKTVYKYDTLGKIITIINAKNQTVNIEYNDNGDVTKKISPDGSYEELAYDEHKNLISHSLLSKDGNDKFTTAYTYDTNHNLVQKIAPNSDTTSYSYNTDNLLIMQTSPKGNSVTYEYDEYKRVQSIIYPNGNSTSYRYDTIGRVIKQIDQLGNEVRFIYDNADRVVEIINALGNSARFTYDQRGNRLTATDPMMNESSYTYDANNNLLTQTNSLGAVSSFEYDGEDRVVKVTDANGNSVSFEYDAMGRVVKSTDAMGNSSSVEYDALGNVKKSYDAMGNMVAELFYNNTNNLIKAVDALNQSTQTSYNLMGQPETITDAKSRVSKFNYDKAGRLVEAIDTMNGKSTQSYDADGNRVDFADPKANKTSYTYNNLGLPTSITTASGSTTSFAYNDKNLLSESINARGQSSTIIYNNDSSIYSIKDEVGTILYSYDKNGNVLTISENGKTIVMTYSVLNQLLSYTDAEENKIAYEYDKVGNLVTLTYPNAKVVTYSYNANSQLSAVTDNGKTTAYQYDKNSRVVKITRPNGTILTRAYNEANQLLSQKDVTPSGAVISEFSFEYDEVGNIIEETNSNEISPKALADIQMTYKAGNLLDEANNTKTVFDADDNMLELGALKLSYDSRNRLLLANDVEYSYDVLNQKIAKSKEGASTKYTVNPNAPLSQLLIMSDTQTTTYTYGLGLISQTKENQTLYYHYDLRGSTIALTNESGEIVDRFSYLPYGKLYKHSLGTTVTPFLYNGRDGVMNEENNLYYMRARFYSTEVKRFVNRDTLIGGIVNSGSLNRFGYVNGNSISFIDPLGLLRQTVNGKYESKISSRAFKIDWGVDYDNDGLTEAILTYGTIYGNNGTEIEALKRINGAKEFQTDCHGFTFTQGEFWINNNQVEKILEADGYVKVTEPQIGDVLIYTWPDYDKYLKENPNFTEIQHSLTVAGYSETGEPIGYGLGGADIYPYYSLASEGWTNPDNSKGTISYYSQSPIYMLPGYKDIYKILACFINPNKP